jgi:hypothetical protein
MAPGSPLRCYAPIAPLTLVATTTALIDGWRSSRDRRTIAASAANTAAVAALTVYLVRTVNVLLPHGAAPLDSSERHRMIKKWHRANRVRLTAVAGAWFTLRCVARSTC